MTYAYVTAEPDVVEAYADIFGRVHPTREQAIDANFAEDFKNSVAETCGKPFVYKEVENGNQLEFAEAIIRQFAVDHEDMLRVLLGDREAT